MWPRTSPVRGYASTASGLASAVTNGPLTALAGGGVYAYGSSSAIPVQHLQREQYWVRRRLHHGSSIGLAI